MQKYHDEPKQYKGYLKSALTTEERTELAALRKDNRELRMERDILKKAAVGSTCGSRIPNSVAKSRPGTPLRGA